MPARLQGGERNLQSSKKKSIGWHGVPDSGDNADANYLSTFKLERGRKYL